MERRLCVCSSTKNEAKRTYAEVYMQLARKQVLWAAWGRFPVPLPHSGTERRASEKVPRGFIADAVWQREIRFYDKMCQTWCKRF